MRCTLRGNDCDIWHPLIDSLFGIGALMLAGAHSKLTRAVCYWHRGQTQGLTRRNARTGTDSDGERGAEREKEKETQTEMKAKSGAHRELNPGPP